LGAIRSITRSWSAWGAGTLTESRTAFSAQSAFRPYLSARLLIVATASFRTFVCSIAPATPTGWAAPMFVPGAIAATGQPIMMNVPAEAARAPLGDV
jgi:hypothetical protein